MKLATAVYAALIVCASFVTTAPTPKRSTDKPVATALTCYFDEDGNMTCVDDDPWDPCGDGSCQ